MSKKIRNSEIDKNKYIRSKQVADEILDILQSNYDNDTKQQNFKNLLEDIDNSNELLSRLSSSSRAERISNMVKSNNKENDILALEKKLSEVKTIQLKKKHHNRVLANRLIKASTIAASICLIFLGIYKYSSDSTNKNMVSTSENANLNSPTLITESGEKVYLTAIKNDNIIKSDNMVDVGNVGNVENIINKNHENIISHNKLITPNKYTTKIKLSDGTTVHINSNSELKFPNKFDGDKRVVELKGEAFFEVTKSDKQFIVVVEGVEVKVYGTRFNINAYNTKLISTVLVEGSVSVNIGNKEMMMKPNNICTANMEHLDMTQKSINVDKYIAWTENKFMYEDDKFETVIRDLNKWYGVDIDIKDESLKNMEITLIYSKEAPITDIFEALEMFDTKIKCIKTERGYDIVKIETKNK